MSIYEFKNLVDLRSGLENSERFYCIEYFTKKVGLMNQTPTEEDSKSCETIKYLQNTAVGLMNQTPTKKSKHYSFLPMTRAGSGGL